MGSQLNQNANRDTQQDPNKKRREPSIRTMQSDIAEYMKKEKPSLIQLLTKQSEYHQEESPTEGKRPLPIMSIIVAGATALVLLSAVGLVSYWYFFLRITTQTLPPETTIGPPIPPPLVATEKTETRIIQKDASSLREVFSIVANMDEKTGSFERIVLQTKNSDGMIRFLTVRELYGALHIIPPYQISDSLIGQPFIAIHFSSEGPRAIFAAESQSRDRTFAGMLAWESSLQRDWELFFLGKPASPALTPFADKTFRNLDYRFMELKPGTGIGYFIFPSKNLLVIATSEETIHTAIDRLFEAR